MKILIATACVLAMICSGVQAQQSAPTAAPQKPGAAKQEPAKVKKASRKKRTTGKKSVHAAAVPRVPAQVMPPVPATLMNSAPVKPQVTMQDGLLTIDAPNSTLGDVMSGIHAATGATIEGVAPSERVAVKLGPGNPRQVIAALLHGTPYDYVILGSLDKPNAVTRVLLTQSSGFEAPEAQNTASGNGSQPPSNQAQSGNPPEHAREEPAEQEAEQAPAEQAPPPQQQPQAQQEQPKSQDQLNRQLQNLGLGPVTPQPQPQPQQQQ